MNTPTLMEKCKSANLKTLRSRITALAALGLLGVIGSTEAAVLYVSTSGSASRSYADMQNALLPSTYQNAYTKAQSGDVIEFAPGVYTKTNLGTQNGYAIIVISKSDLTLRAQNRAPSASAAQRSIIRGEAYQADDFYHVIHIFNESNITIDGFEIESSATNNGTLDGHVTGITVEASDRITCRYNVVHDCGQGGILSVATRNAERAAIDASDYVIIDHNIIYNNAGYPTSLRTEGSGISLLHVKNANPSDIGFHSKVTNNIVYNNRIIDNHENKPSTDGNGIIIDTNAGNNGSRPYTNYTDISGNPIPKTLVENNVVYKNGGAGIHVFRSANITIRNNSTYSNGMDTSFSAAEIDSNACKDVLFANNISQGNPARTNLKIFWSGGSGLSAVTWHNNTYWNTGGSGTIAVTGTVNYGLLELDPRYFNPTGGDLRLGNYFPAAGINVGSTASGDYSATDILGVARPVAGAYDRGAYER